MEKRLLVLYQSDKDRQQFYAIYSGGKEEADEEGRLMRSDDGTLRERARIWISTTAQVEWFSHE